MIPNELRGESYEQHRQRLHDPRDPEAEPCCPECCDCQNALAELP